MSTLLHAATLGLNRQRIRWEQETEWSDIAAAGTSPAEKLLRVLAARQLAEKAAFEPESILLSETEAAPPEKRPYLDAAGAHIMYQVIHARSRRLLEEALGLLVKKEELLSPEYLPLLLDIADELEVDKKLLLQACGERLHWLAAKRPAWLIYLPLSAESWKTGSLQQRLRWFVQQRAQQPETAHSLWAGMKKTASSDELIAFTQLLKPHLSEADEDKLEPLLDHRRKDVRTAAFPLLTRIPDTELIRRMKKRAESCFKMEKGVLKVALPEIRKEWERDGFSVFSYAASGLGEKAGYLCHLLACIPPDHWEKSFQESPEKLITKALNSKWAEAVVLAFTLASIRQRDAKWATELLKTIFQNSKLLDVIKPNVRVELIQLIPVAERDRLFIKAMSESERFDTLLVDFSLIIDHDDMLSQKVAWTFYQKLRDSLIRRVERGDQRFRYLLYELPNVALRTPIGLYPQIAALFPYELLGNGSYRHYLEEMLQTLDFRYKMYKTFT